MIIKLICSVCQDNFVTINTDSDLSEERVETLRTDYSCGGAGCVNNEHYTTIVQIEEV
jgi:hypothetical protein